MTLPDLNELAGIPREEADEGAVEWVVARLTERQKDALVALSSDHIAGTACALGVNANTLWSLNDFRRAERDIWTPFSVAAWDWGWDGKREWRLTKFGASVLAALKDTNNQGCGRRCCG
jgi:hypothetical protein